MSSKHAEMRVQCLDARAENMVSMFESLKQSLHRKRVLCQKISTSYLNSTTFLVAGLKKPEDLEYIRDDPSIEGDLEMQAEASMVFLEESIRVRRNANAVGESFLLLGERYSRYAKFTFPTVFFSEKELRQEFIRSTVVMKLAESTP